MTKELILYYLFVVIFLDILYLAHRYIFAKYSYLKWDRFYFLFIILFSFVLPILPLPSFFSIDTNLIIAQQTLQKIDFSQGIATVQGKKTLVNLDALLKSLYLIYLIGFALKLSLKIWELVKLRKHIRHTIPINLYGYKLHKTNSKELAYTLLRKIYVSETFLSLDKEKQIKILKHESVHAKQLHTLDILLFKISGIFIWFNPLNRAILQTIKSIHEFIADEEIIKKENPKDYMQLLLQMAVKRNELTIISRFAGINLKKRIEIMKRYSNSQRQKRLFAGFIPVIFLIYFSFTLFTPFLKGNDLKTSKEFISPFTNSYRVIAPYFEVVKKDKNIKISHKSLSVALPDYSPILACCNAQVTALDTIDNWGVSELKIKLLHYPYTIIYSGLYKSTITNGKIVKKGDTIGYTGKLALYPKIELKVLLNDKAIPTSYLINF